MNLVLKDFGVCGYVCQPDHISKINFALVYWEWLKLALGKKWSEPASRTSGVLPYSFVVNGLIHNLGSSILASLLQKK